jgi:hypothetical protein
MEGNMEMIKVNDAIQEAAGWLEDCINGAEDWLDRAASKAEDTSCDGQWKPVADLAEKLRAIQSDLNAAITPEIQKLIKDAQSEADHLADMADANSY